MIENERENGAHIATFVLIRVTQYMATCVCTHRNAREVNNRIKNNMKPPLRLKIESTKQNEIAMKS